jgi:hypothetical protein
MFFRIAARGSQDHELVGFTAYFSVEGLLEIPILQDQPLRGFG